MSSAVLANLYTAEGSVNGTVTITFPWKPRKTVIANDSSISDLTVTIKGFNITLKATETVTITIILAELILTSSAAINYRVWGFG